MPRAFSWTSLRTYEKCPLRWKLKNLDRAPSEAPPSSRMVLGRALHAAVEAYHRTGGRGSDAAARHALDGHGLDEAGRADARALLATWSARESRRRSRIVAVEKPFRMELGGVPFEGVIDRIDALPDGRVAVVDYKSGASLDAARWDAHNGAQLGYYQMGAERALGHTVDHVAIEHVRSGLRFTGDRRPEPVLEALTERVTTAWDAIGDGKFPYRAGPECPCEYARRCPLWSDRYPKIEDWTGEKRAKVSLAVARYAATRDADARAEIEAHFASEGVARAWGEAHVVERDAGGALRVKPRPAEPPPGAGAFRFA